MNADASPIKLSGWALVLGASSGFGAATSVALARAGCHIFGVHLDRKATLPNAQRVVADIQALGREVRFWNVNAADEEKRMEVAGEMDRILRERDEMGQLRVMLHSLAFGTLRLFIADPMKEAVTKMQMDMTLDVMAHSLIYWAQEIVSRGLMGHGGRIYAMTSSGGTRVLPYYLRYVMGGEYQIRGVDLRSVGPVDENQRVVGGDKFVLFNAEYYLDVFGPVRALLFHDAGQAFAESQPIDLRQLRTSTGVELRVIVPMLNVPFRLIYAWNIYRDAFQPARALKFAVGTTF
jgi:hypothetical protein